MNKSNVMRLLESAGIDYEILEYEVDESDLSGASVAKKTGRDKDSVFKTLVITGDKNGFGVCCIPVCDELDLKKRQSISAIKKPKCSM